MKSLPRLWIFLFLLLGIGVSYWFIDRPLCEYIHDKNWPQYLSSAYLNGKLPCVTPASSVASSSRLTSQIVDWPPVMTGLSPFLILIGLACCSGRSRELMLFMGVSILLTFVMKNDLKWIFSRNWPLTWTHNNLSWISNHAYGFQWFQGNLFQGVDATGSFPSGHTAVAFAALMPIGLMFWRAMPCCIAVATLEGLLMVAFNYHFLSDVLAGALIGVLCSLIARRIVLPEYRGKIAA